MQWWRWPAAWSRVGARCRSRPRMLPAVVSSKSANLQQPACLYAMRCCHLEFFFLTLLPARGPPGYMLPNPSHPLAYTHPAGYRDYSQLRTDPDLEGLRGDERFENLLKRFERAEPAKKSGFLGLF